jgi:hypothetical protein
MFFIYFCVVKSASIAYHFKPSEKTCLFGKTCGIKALLCVIMVKTSLELRKCNCFSKLNNVKGFIYQLLAQ